MIQLSSAGKRFGHKLLFEDADWQINPQDRIGLVGANGTGKTTLLRILAGQESLDYGTCQGMRNIAAGYLPQDGLSLSGRSIFAECMAVFSELQAMEEEMETIAHSLAELDPEGPEYGQASDRLHRLQDEFRMRDGYAIEARVGSVLTGLGFKKEDWPRHTEEFSGGWQMRIALAKLLLQQPNLLLLDEPTNHLDLEARNWLEDYLRHYPYAFLLISHDRYFLDVTVNKIVEIWNQKLHSYTGGYDKYLEQKKQRFEQLEAAARNQRERREQLEVFINRFRYQATKAKQVQSRIKELERMDRIELPPEERTIHFRFSQPKPSGRAVVELTRADKSYGEKQVLRDVSFVIERGDRVALVGVNGAGKSTLIRMLAGTEPLTAGALKLGHNVDPDYFAQDQYKELDAGARVLDDLGALSPASTQTELRNLLGCFLFRDDDVFKQIGVLSGGERNRYALLRLLLHPANFLLLDEPTNHLDMRAKDVLLHALLDYSGTVVFVSHDRYFIDKLATRVFEVADSGVHVYPGNYEDYLWRKEQRAGGEATPPLPATQASHSVPPPTLSTKSPVDQEEVAEDRKKRLNPLKRKQIEERCQEVEEEIARTETAISQCETGLQEFVSVDETRRLNMELERYRAALESLMQEWEELSGTLET